MRKWLITGILSVSSLMADRPELDRARELYAQTNYQNALQALAPLVSAADGEVHQLIGQIHFMMGDFKKASEAFEKALAANPDNSSYFHWLGRAYGRRAETSNPFAAPGFASKARQNFEKAVALDPKNLEAINDLFEYYLEAPGFLGGGIEKAKALTAKIQAVDPAEYHYAMAKVAERRKEFNTAEDHFRRAMDIAPKQVGRVLDLAKFLSNQGRVQESEAVFAQAEKIAPNEPKLLFERANLYIKHRQNLPTAKVLLEKYLKSPLTPDDPSREEAQKLLKMVAGA